MQLTLSLVTRNRANNTLILKMTIHQKTSKTFWIMRQKRKYHKMPPNADYFATKIKKERKKSRTKKKKKKKTTLKTKSHQDNVATKSHPMLIHVLFSSFFTTGQSLCLITLLVINYSFFKNNFFILN